MPDVSGILVNYNAGSELRYALESMAAELSECDWEAVVVDNASTDGSGDVVSEFSPRARLLRNERNVGSSGRQQFSKRFKR